MSKKSKNYSPAHHIESRNITWAEQGLVKFPGEEMVPMEDEFREHNVIYSPKKFNELFKTRKNKTYQEIHTHPYDPFELGDDNIPNSTILPSGSDLNSLLADKDSRIMFIAQQNMEHNEVEGYVAIRKTKGTQKVLERASDEELKNYINDYKTDFENAFTKDDPEIIANSLKSFSNKYHLQVRFVPGRDFEIDGSGMRLKEKDRTLEHELVVGIVLAISASLFFFNPGVTGAVTGLLKGGGSFILVSTLAILMVLFGMYKIYNEGLKK